MRDARCLVQALALTRLLRATGHPARLYIGVARPTDQLHAHAWVELEGVVLDPQPPATARLQPLALPSNGAVADPHPGVRGCG